MDDLVRQAMAKWPNVPHCYGWLGLDARGNWYMRDDKAQAAGPFAGVDGGTPTSRGSRLQHDKLVNFIQRNYGHDDQGQWFFQNGPQRVYVELEATPYIWRVSETLDVSSHAGQAVTVRDCLLDESGWVYLECLCDGEAVLGLVHTQDVGWVAEAIAQGRWTPRDVSRAELPGRYGYMRSPAATRAQVQTQQAQATQHL